MAATKKAEKRKSQEKGGSKPFFEAENWKKMWWIREKLRELQPKLTDNSMKEVFIQIIGEFDSLWCEFDKMYRRVGEEIWVIEKNRPVILPELWPYTYRIGKRSKIPIKTLKRLTVLPGLEIEVRLPGEEDIKNKLQPRPLAQENTQNPKEDPLLLLRKKIDAIRKKSRESNKKRV